ncbi:MAG: ABC transporter substrate-binding protein [Hyphomicrobiales bacterium]|nr:ABC transporter substrate-binding protein [Hyphomicrobiales bacterium]
MSRSNSISAGVVLVLGAVASTAAPAQDTVKVGAVLPLTGGLAAIGKQVQAGIKLYVERNGAIAGNKRIELIIKDDGGVPDNSKRLAQELIVNDKVAVVGSALTPSAMAVGPLSTQAKTANVVMVSGTSAVINPNNPYMVRTSFTLGQQSEIIGQWAAKNGSKKVVIVQSDWAPGAEATAVFTDSFTRAGGQVVETIKVPLANPDFAPFLQRARDLNPDTLFVFVPAGQAGTFAKQFAERGLDRAGIKLIGPGDVTDDDDLPGMGEAMLGVVTAGTYSALHNSQMNKDYVAAFKKANSFRPNFISLGGYDGMHAIYEALKKTGGKTDGESLIGAMKGMKWESPRGPISIDPDTRDIVQNVYVRKVEKVQGELYNVEFATFEAVKDPLKTKR